MNKKIDKAEKKIDTKDTKKVEDFKDLRSQLIKLKGIYCSNDYLKNWFEVDTINQLKILNNSRIFFY